MPYSTNKGLSLQATGSNAGVWGSDGTTPTAGSSNALNQGVTQLIDQALGGTTTLSLSSSTPITLTQAQCQNGMLRVTGALLANIVVQPDPAVYCTGFYCWENVTTGSFTVTLTNSAGSVVLPQGRRGLLWIDTTNGPRITSIVGSTSADPVPAGSVVPFYNTAAPAGYTIVSSLNDYALKIVSSSGGVASGSVNYSTLFGRTGTDGHTLTTNEIPSHSHGVTGGVAGGDGFNSTNGGGGSIVPNGNFTITISPTGGGASHTHDMDMRVKTAALVLATRN